MPQVVGSRFSSCICAWRPAVGPFFFFLHFVFMSELCEEDSIGEKIKRPSAASSDSSEELWRRRRNYDRWEITLVDKKVSLHVCHVAYLLPRWPVCSANAKLAPWWLVAGWAIYLASVLSARTRAKLKTQSASKKCTPQRRFLSF